MNQDIHQYVAFGLWAQRPASLNPSDRTLSKRDWEEQIAKTRIHWRRIHGVRQLVCTHGFQEEPALAAWQQANEHFNLARCILMGFEEQAAKTALEQTEDDIGKATQILVQ